LFDESGIIQIDTFFLIKTKKSKKGWRYWRFVF